MDYQRIFSNHEKAVVTIIKMIIILRVAESKIVQTVIIRSFLCSRTNFSMTDLFFRYLFCIFELKIFQPSLELCSFHRFCMLQDLKGSQHLLCDVIEQGHNNYFMQNLAWFFFPINVLKTSFFFFFQNLRILRQHPINSFRQPLIIGFVLNYF